jgi:uncharacterized protein involved in response to NO
MSRTETAPSTAVPGTTIADRIADAHWLSGGFRPFFLLGALAMAASVLAWIPLLLGIFEMPTVFSPRDWHVHAMIFGGIPTLVAGFALTAVSNWTGRQTVAGKTLLLLVLLWLLGRIAVSASEIIGAGPAAAVDLLFLIALTVFIGFEVIAARNYRNLRVVGVIGLLSLANGAFHAEAWWFGHADYSARAAVAIVLVLIMLIGGRIVPAFTRNWLAARKSARLPAAFSRLDGAAMTISSAVLVAWVAAPFAPATALALLLAGLLNVWRMARWSGMQTRSEPLLSILHLGYAMIPLGFIAVAASIFEPGLVNQAAALHIWTMGAFGIMTLAVMTRASRGHCGQPLNAGKREIAIFALVLIGLAARMLSPYAVGIAVQALELAALGWALAYLVFAAGYARMLLIRPRLIGAA